MIEDIRLFEELKCLIQAHFATSWQLLILHLDVNGPGNPCSVYSPNFIFSEQMSKGAMILCMDVKSFSNTKSFLSLYHIYHVYSVTDG